MREPSSFCSSKRAELEASHSPNIPYALAFKPFRILPLPSHLLSPPPPPNLYCWSSSILIKSSILIENNSPCVLFQFWSCLTVKSKMLLQLKLTESLKSPPPTHQFLPHLPHVPPAQISWATPKLTTPLKTCLFSVGPGKLIRLETAQSLDVRQGKEQGHTWEGGHKDRKAAIFGGSPHLYKIKMWHEPLL